MAHTFIDICVYRLKQMFFFFFYSMLDEQDLLTTAGGKETSLRDNFNFLKRDHTHISTFVRLMDMDGELFS